MATPKPQKPAKKLPGAKKPGRAAPRVDGLLPKQAAFVSEYLLSGNATQAAINAGYSEKTAYKIGAENLRKPQIAALLAQKQVVIAQRQDSRLERMELTDERISREIARIAFFDPRRMFDTEGNPKPLHELDDDTAAAIAGLEVLEQFEGRGEDRVFVGYLKKYKIADKNAALTNAAKILGMFKKDNEQPGEKVANAITSLLLGMKKSALPVVQNPDEDEDEDE